MHALPLQWRVKYFNLLIASYLFYAAWNPPFIILLWISTVVGRWHITLSAWLRDYLCIPLGGNRHGEARTYFALMLTMLLGGLWHGASWTFVV